MHGYDEANAAALAAPRVGGTGLSDFFVFSASGLAPGEHKEPITTTGRGSSPRPAYKAGRWCAYDSYCTVTVKTAAVSEPDDAVTVATIGVADVNVTDVLPLASVVVDVALSVAPAGADQFTVAPETGLPNASEM